ncbi:putative G-protein coupled receptor 133 [Stylophora pistillata]|uniref:Putative G-protein coupled receptor 133 n=1 Tax=Stylophora pistillata TaxID=50429 RepID=A0A2B4REB7_STYPI|nr:putative G-protein coupled receptor 133 [Stylophora pistillata]
MRLFNEFTNQYQNITKPIKGQLGKGEVTKGTEAIFKVAVAFEKLVLDYSRYHLNEKKPLKKMYDRRMGSVVIGCVYKDLHELLLTNQPIGNGTNNSSPGGFTDEGCLVDSTRSNSEETVCRCNHLTYFAVLVDFDSGGTKLTKRDGTILETITYVGLSLSIIGILLTIILYSFLTDARQPLSQIRLSLSVSLGAGQMIFLAGINATENVAACIAAAALMQYFLMAAFCWMLVEGIYLYLFVVKVYNINTKMHMYHVMSWGLPIVMVGISLGIAAGKEGLQSYTSDKYCWLSSTNKLIWIFVTFVAFIESLNILILVRVIREITTLVEPLGEDNYGKQIRLGIRACAVMVPLLGVTRLFGLLSPLHKAFAYIFNILNSTQIKERFNRKVNTVFPSVNKGNSTKKSSQVNLSDVGDARGVELGSYH